jgi:hypothetical protein
MSTLCSQQDQPSSTQASPPTKDDDIHQGVDEDQEKEDDQEIKTMKAPTQKSISQFI